MRKYWLVCAALWAVGCAGETLIGFDETVPEGRDFLSFRHQEQGFAFEICTVDASGKEINLGNNLRVWSKNGIKPDSPSFPFPFSGNSLYVRNAGQFPLFRLTGRSSVRLLSVDVMNNAYSPKVGRVVGYRTDGGTVQTDFKLGGQSAETVQLPEFSGIDLSGFCIVPADGTDQIQRFAVDNIRLEGGTSATSVSVPPPVKTPVVSPVAPPPAVVPKPTPAPVPAVTSTAVPRESLFISPEPDVPAVKLPAAEVAAPAPASVSSAPQPRAVAVAPAAATAPQKLPSKPGIVPLILSLAGFCAVAYVLMRRSAK
jgi:hypothetical protein